MRRGKPCTSAEQEPHFAALQFQRTARSGAMFACTQSTASRTTIPSRTGTRYEAKSPPFTSPRQILRSSFESSTSLRLLGRVARERALDRLGEVLGHRLAPGGRDLHAGRCPL